MTQHGTQPNTHRLATIDDLDALLAGVSLAPTIVKLSGKEYRVRTDLTANEVAMFRALNDKGLNEQAFTLLLGTPREIQALKTAVKKSLAGQKVELPAGAAAKRLVSAVEDMPQVHVTLTLARIMRASKALADLTLDDAVILRKFGIETEEPEESGESSAS